MSWRKRSSARRAWGSNGMILAQRITRCFGKKRRRGEEENRSSALRQVRGDEVEDAVGDDELGGFVDFRKRAVTGDDQNLIVIGVKADGLVRDIIGHDEIGALRFEFLSRVFLHRVGFGGES